MPLERPVAAVARPVLLAGAVRIEWRCHTFSTLFCVRVLSISDRNRGCMQPAGGRGRGNQQTARPRGDRQSVGKTSEGGTERRATHSPSFGRNCTPRSICLSLPLSLSLQQHSMSEIARFTRPSVAFVFIEVKWRETNKWNEPPIN